MPGPNRAPRGGYQKPKDLGKTISRLLGYLTRSKLPLMAVFGCLLISVFTNIGGSYMMRGIINDFIWSGCTDFAGLGRAILALVGVYLVGCLATYSQSAIMVRLAQRGVNRLRSDLFDKLQNLPLSYFDKHPHGELMSRFTNDADNVQLALEQSVVSMCSSCLMFVGLVAMMLFINWKLFLVTALVLALTMVLFNKLGGRSRRFYQKQQAALGDVNGDIQEIIEGLKVVKAFTHEEQAKAQGIDYMVGKFPMSANGKALILNGGEGLVKIIAGREYGEVLGMHIIGPRATDLICEGALAIGSELTLDELAATIHSHPTVTETMRECALDALGRAVHIPPRRK